MQELSTLAAALGALVPSPSPAGEPAPSPSADAPAYYVIYQDVHDEARFNAYVAAVTPAITKRGGVLVAAGAPTFTEGHLPYRRLVVFRYPARRVLEQFIGSEEYTHIRGLREGAADWASAIVPAIGTEAE